MAKGQSRIGNAFMSSSYCICKTMFLKIVIGDQRPMDPTTKGTKINQQPPLATYMVKILISLSTSSSHPGSSSRLAKQWVLQRVMHRNIKIGWVTKLEIWITRWYKSLPQCYSFLQPLWSWVKVCETRSQIESYWWILKGPSTHPWIWSPKP